MPEARLPTSPAASATDDDMVLTLRAAGQEVALPAVRVDEILRLRPLTRVPLGPPSLLGVLGLRGVVLPVVSLARLLDATAIAPVAAPQPAARIVVIRGGAGGQPIGLLVDAVVSLGASSDATVPDMDALLAGVFGTRAVVVGRAGTDAAAGALPEPVAEGTLLDLLGFMVAGQDYALPLEAVLEVASCPERIVRLPHADATMLGAATLRGVLLPMLSLRVLLGLPHDEAGAAGRRVVVIALHGARVGLVVDAVTSVLRVPAVSIDPVPPILVRGAAEARIEGICRLEQGRRLVAILQPGGLVEAATMRRLALAVASDAAEAGSQDGAEAAVRSQMLVFRLGAEQYALPVGVVDEVLRHPGRLTRMPYAPGFIEGVLHRRGRVLPVIDQRQRFAVAEVGLSAGRRIVVLTVGRLQAGLAVDSVSDVIGIAPSALSAAPSLDPLFDRVALLEDGARTILVVDPSVLLGRAERELVEAFLAAAQVSATAVPPP